MVPPSRFLGIFVTCFYIPVIIWRKFLKWKEKKRKKKTSMLGLTIIYFQLLLLRTIFQQLVHKLVQWNSYFLSWLYKSVLTTSNVYSWPRNICAPTTSIFRLLCSKVSKTSCHFEPKLSLYASHGAAKLDLRHMVSPFSWGTSFSTGLVISY